MPSIDSPVLSVEGASLSRGGRMLLDGVSFDVNRGEVVSVIGPNGAGKSTLLRALCHELPIDGGRIRFHDRDLPGWAPRERARVMAVLPQSSSLAFPYTVREVVALGRMPHDSGSGENTTIIDLVLSELQLEPFGNRAYTTLSSGEKQRVQLGRVLAQVWGDAGAGPAPILLLDEPLTALDMKHQQELMQSLRRVAQRGIAVVMVLHDLNMAMAWSDRMLALKDGRQYFHGGVEEVNGAGLFNGLFDISLGMFVQGDSGRKLFA